MNTKKCKENIRSKRVLVVDDQVSSSTMAASFLKMEGCYVEVANTGWEAAQSMAEYEYDLLVLDWNMPAINGGETLKLLEDTLKKYEINIPFVIYSGVEPIYIDLPHTKRFRLVDYWNKSGNFSDWHKRLKNVIKRLERGNL